MKRFHVHVSVTNLVDSVHFHRELFAGSSTVYGNEQPAREGAAASPCCIPIRAA